MSNEYVAHEEDIDGFTIKIIQDSDPLNPIKRLGYGRSTSLFS